MKCPYQMLDETGKPFTPASYPLRSDIPTPPPSMAHLPVDERGYPVPFFVAWINGKPEFRGASRQAAALCVKENLCWVCGSPLNGERVFTIGPMCSVNRVSSEPPAHIACARYSVKACPFLTKPQMVRRENDLPDERYDFGDDVSLKHNPGVTLLWFARDFEIEEYPEGRLWRFTTSPVSTEWYARGRGASREEVLAAFALGLPKLQAEAKTPNDMEFLQFCTTRAMRLVPKL